MYDGGFNLTGKRLYPTIRVQAGDPDKITIWQDAVADAWQEMPIRAKQVANRLVTAIIVVPPTDPRLSSGYTQGSRAALIDDSLVLSCAEDAKEIWHEIGHAIIVSGLSSDERDIVDSLYNCSNSERPPEERLAEDFYFTVKGESSSPFWQWWFTDGIGREAERKTVNIDPLDIVEAVLDVFAEELVYENGGEEYVWLYGIAMEAINEAQKETQFSYENLSAPHQYYYTEDLVSPATRSRKKPMQEPLRVERPDVTMRGTYATPPVV